MFEILDMRKGSYFIKILDFILATLGIILVSPIVLIVALAIKVDSKGPVFFSQERLGRHKKPFRLIKFRTMVFNAEQNGPVWAHKNDNRVTGVGRFLRNKKLDEIPQLLNILKGDLSFVGPRPIRKHFADIIQQHDPNYDKRFCAKPGLTGWAQIYAPYGSTVGEQLEKLPYDLKYLNGYNVKDYFKILLLTGKKVVTGKGV